MALTCHIEFRRRNYGNILLDFQNHRDVPRVNFNSMFVEPMQWDLLLPRYRGKCSQKLKFSVQLFEIKDILRAQFARISARISNQAVAWSS